MRPTQSGFSMIEVLVSVVLICVGLLGIAALQSKAVPFTQDSVQRNAAIMLSNDLLELVRSQPQGRYIKLPGADFPGAPSSCLPTPVAPADQLGCWATQASALLPGAADLLNSSFYVCRNVTPGPTGAAAACDGGGDYLEIQVAWSAPLDSCLDGTTTSGGTSSICTYRVRTRL